MSSSTLPDIDRPSTSSTNTTTTLSNLDVANLPNVNGSTKPAAMAPSAVDLLLLTYNCAKTLVNANIFANHVHTALTNHATTLPDIVVFSIQEIAPLSTSFTGRLDDYYARLERALNLAAQRHEQNGAASRDEPLVSVTQTNSVTESSKPQDRPYTIVDRRNVGYTAILVFTRDPERIRDVQHGDVGFGAAEMGNKGAVSVRILYDVDGTGAASTEMTFVATHLAAMEWNLARRNANWAAIMQRLTFSNPEAILDKLRGLEGTPPPTPHQSDDDSDASTERHRLLQETHHEEHLQVRRAMHNISVFKPSSHLFVLGDLNYRISTSSPPPNAVFPSLDPDSENYYPTFLPFDQLTRERHAGRTMHGLSEHEIRFPPTYKYDVLPKESSVADEDELEVPWNFAPHRYPSWTDRILYLDLPPWVKSRSDNPKMRVLAYDALPLLRNSDHRPVYLRMQVPLIAPKDLSPPASIEQNPDIESIKDPRVRLPVEIDPEAWSRRHAARQKELVTGWSAFLWTTKEGAWILTTVLAVGLTTWWLYKTG